MAINQSINLILCQYLSVFNLIGRGGIFGNIQTFTNFKLIYTYMCKHF